MKICYFSSNYYRNQIKFNNWKFQLKLLFSLFGTITFTDTHNFGLVWPKTGYINISNESYRHTLVQKCNNSCFSEMSQPDMACCITCTFDSSIIYNFYDELSHCTNLFKV